MTTLTVGQGNGHDIDIDFEDHGSGEPVVLIHGVPLDGRSWDEQERVLVDVLGGTRISEPAWQAGPYAVRACVGTWLTDFREDLATIGTPVLVVHGDADRILPHEAPAARLPALIPGLTCVTVKDGPHNIARTHPEVVNPALLDFLKA